jgi:hypothetical protein
VQLLHWSNGGEVLVQIVIRWDVRMSYRLFCRGKAAKNIPVSIVSGRGPSKNV